MKIYKRTFFIPTIVAVLSMVLFVTAVIFARAADDQSKKQNAARAEESLSAKMIEIDGIKYSIDQLIEDFINVAISNHGWLDDAPESTKTYVQYTSDKEESCKIWKGIFPVISEYLCRENGIPKLYTLNKWDDFITIGIGWPLYLHWDSYRKEILKAIEIPDFKAAHDSTMYPLFKEQVLSLIPDIKKYTNIPVTFVEPGDRREIFDINNPEKTKTHARIRIVPTRFTNTRIETPRHSGFSTLEPLFLNGVPFTPFEVGQVDGYILPDADNTIGFAVCRINPELGETLIRAMITECLARVLGLPELSKLNSGSVLGHWNKAAGDYTWNFFENRKTEEDKKFKNMKYAEDAIMAWRKTLTKYEYPLNLVDTKGHEKGFSAYDRFMIALLYCPAIKPGMNVQEAKEILQTNEVCWQQAEQKIKEN